MYKRVGQADGCMYKSGTDEQEVEQAGRWRRLETGMQQSRAGWWLEEKLELEHVLPEE